MSDAHFRVVDHGLFLPLARRLARDNYRVTYYTPDERAFPTVADAIGKGFPEIERVDSLWQQSDRVDCFVFPDVGFAHDQAELIRQGFPVWGALDADKLETNKARFLTALANSGLPMPTLKSIKGMNALKEHLRDQEDKYIKISRYRGNWETMHFTNWAQCESELDYRSVKLGPWKEEITFYVFDPIETQNEDGCDSYCVDGQFPSLVIHGMESKDKAYLGAFQKMADLPEEVRCVNEAFAPILGSYDYRSFFSTEVRITADGDSYFIDPTCRAGSPPSQVMCEMIDNLGEIILEGANGKLVEPVPYAKFGVQALVTMPNDKCTFRSLEIPGEIDRWFKAGHCAKIGKATVFAPDPDNHFDGVGWMVGVGDRIGEALRHLRHNIDQLPDGCCCEYEAMADLLKEAIDAEEKGMQFTDQTIPDPASILED